MIRAHRSTHLRSRALGLFVCAAILAPRVAAAYDSRCRVASPDCQGVEAAHTQWTHVEHAELWLRTRALAGLPAAVDDTFTVDTWTDGSALGRFPSLRPAPLDQATAIVQRTVDLAMFAQLPDLSHSVWDWASGNDGCPPTDTLGFEACHLFESHMGWLNSTHFPPQSGQVFTHLHGIALERARRCAAMKRALDAAGRTEPTILAACDRQALLFEAVAHHFLQDAWSMGHTWERWGSPDLADFRAAVRADASLVDLKTVGDAVGRASGLIHGAKAISTFADAMCSPDDGIDFIQGGERLAGAGDLNLTLVLEDARFEAQRAWLDGCATTALREVYLASAQSLGALGASQVPGKDLAECFAARATNRAIGLGAAIQIPAGVVVALAGPLATPFILSSADWLSSLGLTQLQRADLYVPLTSELLTRVNGVVPIEGGAVFNPQIRDRWQEDMRRIQGRITVMAAIDPEGTGLARGAMGPLLGMRPNRGYSGVPPYADPAATWAPTAITTSIEPLLANAPNILARTFVDAQAPEWCSAITADGASELSLTHLRDRCTDTSLPSATRMVACEICSTFAARHLVSAAPGSTQSTPPLCRVLAPTAAVVETALDAPDRGALASTWCATPPGLTFSGEISLSLTGSESSESYSVSGTYDVVVANGLWSFVPHVTAASIDTHNGVERPSCENFQVTTVQSSGSPIAIVGPDPAPQFPIGTGLPLTVVLPVTVTTVFRDDASPTCDIRTNVSSQTQSIEVSLVLAPDLSVIDTSMLNGLSFLPSGQLLPR